MTKKLVLVHRISTIAMCIALVTLLLCRAIIGKEFEGMIPLWTLPIPFLWGFITVALGSHIQNLLNKESVG